MAEQTKVLLIGCGQYARKWHLPTLAEYSRKRAGKVSVPAVVISEGELAQVRRAFNANGLIQPKFYQAKHLDLKNTKAMAKDAIREHKPTGAIISCVSAFNYELVKLCVDKGIHTLVEKPATCPPDCSWKSGQAAKIAKQMIAIARRAGEKKVRVIVGAQRRYEQVYQRVSDILRAANQEVEVVNVLHASPRDWVRDEMYDEEKWRVNPSFSGGKIMHSGYHSMDIAVLWLKQVNQGIKRAKVSSMFDWYPNPKSGAKGRGQERTASIQVQFFKDGSSVRPSCTANFFLTTAGYKYSTAESYYVGTTTKRTGRGGHLLLQRIQSSWGLSVSPTLIWQVGTKPEVKGCWPTMPHGNAEPTKQFLRLLTTQHGGKSVSSIEQHIHCAQLVQAAYLSAIEGRVKNVVFSDSVDWSVSVDPKNWTAR